MTEADFTLPTALVEAQQEGFDFRDGAGVDFEPYPGSSARPRRGWTPSTSTSPWLTPG